MPKTAKKVTPVKKTTKAATAPPKRADKTSPKKGTTAKSASTPVAVRESNGREFDEHGFVIGSDSSIICQMLIDGGETRGEVNSRIAAELETTTRNGNEKNVSSLVSGLLSRLKARGYKIEGSWRVVPPTPEEAKAAQRAAARAAKKAAATEEAPKAAPTPKKTATPAKKAGAKGTTKVAFSAPQKGSKRAA